MRVAAFLLAATLPAAVLAAPAPQLSWGKANVSLATYRSESVGCAMRAYYTDVGDTHAAKNFVQGSRQIDTIVNSGADYMDQATSIGHVVDSVNADQGIKEIKNFQLDLVAKCLLDHGYHRFRLTDDQRKHLEKLKIGSDARHTYLHKLAADPDILERQAAPDPVISATN
jgi:hypothetical protein